MDGLEGGHVDRVTVGVFEVGEIDRRDGLVDGVSNHHARAAGSVPVGERTGAVDVTATDFRVIGGKRPDKSSLGGSGTSACAARCVTDANGPFHVDEFPVRDVDRRARIDDELSTLGNLNIALEVHGT